MTHLFSQEAGLAFKSKEAARRVRLDAALSSLSPQQLGVTAQLCLLPVQTLVPQRVPTHVRELA